ncbi:pyridine nucleotide-disulfide oxidoreductase dimerization region [mine drainage metagenome]|uniref:Pyridine nucleotide-disulfide oxidoreductase dimerization region n=1 Tax=mine drainage metagenome TaxID=410659 RepID=T0ZT10_9ZZZZ
MVGAGAAGLSAASIASRIGARVTLIEVNRLGGDCLYTGCIPSKTLLRVAACAQSARESHTFGIHVGEITVDFTGVREQIRRAIAAIEPEDSPERYQSLGVRVLKGEATLIDPHTIRVGQETITTRSIVLATGASPIIPALPGLAGARWVTSETVWELESCPGRLVVLGGGAVGCELGQAFTRLGSQVTLVESGSRILGREPEVAAEQLMPVLRREGIKIFTATRALRIEGTAPQAQLVVSHADGTLGAIDFDVLLIAIGRAPRNHGIEGLHLAREPDGRIATNRFLATSQPGIYAAGDVTCTLQFTHVAGQQGVYAALNALFRPLLRLRWNKSPVPRVTYTSPEIASVTRPGLRPSDLAETIAIPLREVNRAVTDGHEDGCALIGVDRSGRAGSATLIMPHAGEIIQELTLAIQERLPLDRILALIHPYPTYAEINRRAAARWRETHLSDSGRRLTRMMLSLLRPIGSG